jgi:two-component system chemotaxis response regulator CheV
VTTKRNEILLESGTNELEILVFSLEEQSYGVNVAKVREVIEPTKVTAMPESHPSVLGVFQLRDTVTPLVDLRKALESGASDPELGKIIIMEFNDVRIGFLVDSVEQIYRVNWKDVSSLPNVDGVRTAPLTSIATINDNMVLMLDFEMLVFDIGGVDLFEESAKRIKSGTARDTKRILLAEDSHVMRNLIHSNLVTAGYTNVIDCIDGQEAWDALESTASDSSIQPFDIVVTDIEMPRMDGLFLTKQIKAHSAMKHLPVVVFSSVVGPGNEKKCRAVGADAQITKPQLDKLVELLDSLIAGRGASIGALQAEPALV